MMVHNSIAAVFFLIHLAFSGVSGLECYVGIGEDEQNMDEMKLDCSQLPAGSKLDQLGYMVSLIVKPDNEAATSDMVCAKVTMEQGIGKTCSPGGLMDGCMEPAGFGAKVCFCSTDLCNA